MATQQQLIYFPYLCFGYTPIKFGGMVLWNFDQEKDKLITDSDLKNYIEKLIGANTFNGRLIQNIAIFSEKPPIFQFSNKKTKLAVELRLILFICTVAKRNLQDGENSGHNMATSENFTYASQNFVLNSEFTGFTSGGIVQINDGGYKVGEINYEKPPFVLQSNLRMDEKLFSALKALKKENIAIYRRILRATDAFMSGYFNSPELSHESRVLQQSRAFEILLQLPEREQRKEFKERIQAYCLPRNKKFQRVYRYLSERPGGKKDSEKNIMAVMWADRFYTLRNHIIHGEKIRARNFLFKKQRHWDIALWIYLILIKKIINGILERDIFYDEILWEEGKFTYQIDSLYRILSSKLSNKHKGKI